MREAVPERDTQVAASTACAAVAALSSSSGAVRDSLLLESGGNGV